MRTLPLIVVLAACGSAKVAHPDTPAAPSSELSPALAPLAWILGDWQVNANPTSMIAAGGAIYGVTLKADGTFDIDILDDAEGGGPADGKLRWFLYDNGRTLEEHQARVQDGSLELDNQMTFRRTGDTLILSMPPQPAITAPSIPHTPAPELEAADLAFVAATKARKVDGWIASFAPDGRMWRKAGAIEHAQIREAMEPLLSSGTLAWAPIASGARGDLGYTVGKATFTGKDRWKSTYVTIWKRQPDGSWKALFDTGRPVNEP